MQLGNYSRIYIIPAIHKTVSYFFIYLYFNLLCTVKINVRPNKHEVNADTMLVHRPSTTLAQHRASPDQTPLPDKMSGSVLHNHPQRGGTI